MTRDKTVMPLKHFKKLVDEAKDLGAELISIFGYGEPLLDRWIVDRIQYCTDKGLKTFITTNAKLLGVNMSDAILKAGLTQIRFSVHGDWNTYHEVHQDLNQTYDEVVRKIANFNAFSKVKYSGQCKVGISVIPIKGENIELLKMAWSKLDLEIWKPHNWTDGKEYRKVSKKRKKTCGRPHTGPVQINADGNMMVCCFDFDAKMTVGNTYKQTIKEILGGKEFNKIRKAHESGNLKGLPCATCDQLNIGDNPLIYSNVDPDRQEGKTSSTKFNLEEKNDVFTVSKTKLSRSCGTCGN